jgi:hypothetical protein
LKLKEEVEETIKNLKRVKAIGAKNNVYLGGNHEDRLERYLMAKAPELYNIISTPKILGPSLAQGGCMAKLTNCQARTPLEHARAS